MYKIVLFVLMTVFYMMLYALQVDQEIAMNTLFRVKHSLNRAAHAGAQQLDGDKLARGVYSIEPEAAAKASLDYLQLNMQLDESNLPRPGTFLRDRVEVLAFDIIDEERTFPYTYIRPDFDYEVTLSRPGVIMIIGVRYPSIYRVMGPVYWEVKAAAELVYP